MGGTQQALLTAAGGGDPYFDDVVFLLDVSGSSPEDKSGYASTVTLSSNAPTCSTAQSKWSGRSAVFTGATCYATAPNAGLLDPGGTSAYTVESWVFLSSAQNWSMVSMLGIDHATEYVDVGYSGTARYLAANTASFGEQFNGFFSGPQVIIPASTWTHIALVRASGTNQIPRLYMGGTYRGQFDVQHSLGSGQSYAGLGWIRGAANSGGTFYLEDYRFTLNQERYTGTGSYTVPTEAFPAS